MPDADTGEMRTPGGRVLSEADVDALAAEAEHGYAMEVGARYRDTDTGHHLLVLHGPSTLDELPGAEWGYTVTAEPGGTLSDDIGALRWTAPAGRYVELVFEPSTVVAELRNVVAKLFDEVDPSDEDGEWDSDRLPTLALAAVTLFQAVDEHLQDGGTLPLEWNPYVSAQPCKTPAAGTHIHDGCRCMKIRCDGRHACPCGHTWETPQG